MAPYLQPYRSSALPDSSLSVSANASSFGGQEAAATQRLGAKLDQIADVRAKMEAIRNLSRGRTDMMRRLEELKTSPDFVDKFGEDGAGYADFVKQEYETFAQDFLNNTDPRAKLFAEQQLITFGESVMQDSMQHEASVATASMVNSVQELVDEGQNTVIMNPKMRDTLAVSIEEAVNQLPDLTSQQRLKLIQDAEQGLDEAQLTGMMRQNPYALKQAIDNGDFARMDFQTVQAARSAADAEISHRERQAEAAQKAAVDAKFLKIGNSLLQADGEFDAGDILNEASFSISQKRTLLEIHKSGFDKSGNDSLYQRLYTDIIRNRGTEEAVSQEDLILHLDPATTIDEKPLSANQYEDLMKLIEEPTKGVTNTFVTNAKSAVTTSNGFMGIQDPEGDRRYGQFTIKANNMSRYAGQKDTPYGDLSGITPEDMFFEGSPHYERFGGALIREYQLSDKQAMDKLLAPSAPNADDLIRRPGESAAEYIKRRKAEGGK